MGSHFWHKGPVIPVQAEGHGHTTRRLRRPTCHSLELWCLHPGLPDWSALPSPGPCPSPRAHSVPEAILGSWVVCRHPSLWDWPECSSLARTWPLSPASLRTLLDVTQDPLQAGCAKAHFFCVLIHTLSQHPGIVHGSPLSAVPSPDASPSSAGTCVIRLLPGRRKNK